MKPKYDLLLRGGHVIDPLASLNGKFDIAVTGENIAAVRPDVATDEAKQVIDVGALSD